MPDLGLVVAGDAVYNGVHQFLGESAGGGRDSWRAAIDTVEDLGPRWVVAATKIRTLTMTPAAPSPRPANTSTTPTSS